MQLAAAGRGRTRRAPSPSPAGSTGLARRPACRPARRAMSSLSWLHERRLRFALPTAAHTSSNTATLACTYTGVPCSFSRSYTCTRSGRRVAAGRDRLHAPDLVGRQREAAVDVGVPRYDHDQVQVGLGAQGRRQHPRDVRGPQVLVLEEHQPPRAPQRLDEPAGHRALAVRARRGCAAGSPGRCGAPAPRTTRPARVPAARGGSGSGLMSARRSRSFSLGQRVVGVDANAGPSQRSRNVVSSAATAGPRISSWASCQGGWSPYSSAIGCDCGSPRWLASSRRPWHRSMPPTNADVAARTAQHHQLLVVRAAAADPLVEQHLAARLADVVAELAVLLLAVGQLLRVGAPHQPLDDDAAPGRVAQQRRRRRALGAEQLVGVALPVGEEQAVARPEVPTRSPTRRAKYALPSMQRRRRRCRWTRAGARAAGLPISSRGQEPVRVVHDVDTRLWGGACPGR